jgi:hypothetical protein
MRQSGAVKSRLAARPVYSRRALFLFEGRGAGMVNSS